MRIRVAETCAYFPEYMDREKTGAMFTAVVKEEATHTHQRESIRAHCTHAV